MEKFQQLFPKEFLEKCPNIKRKILEKMLKESPNRCKKKFPGISSFEEIFGAIPRKHLEKLLKELLEKFPQELMEKSQRKKSVGNSDNIFGGSLSEMLEKIHKGTPALTSAGILEGNF